MPAQKLPPPFVPAPINLRQPESEATIRTIPELIEHNAHKNRDALFCIQALAIHDAAATSQPASVRLTMRELHAAVLRCSRHLQSELLLDAGPPDDQTVTRSNGSNNDSTDEQRRKPAPVALLMGSDLSLVIHLFALLALGVPVMLLSARLGPAAVRHLLAATETRAVLCSSPRLVRTAEAAIGEQDGVEEAGGKEGLSVVSGVKVCRTVTFQEFLNGDESENYGLGSSICAEGHYVGEKDRNVIILHSSGTTGLPKPIYQPHRYLLSYASCHIRTEEEDVEALNLSTLPLYHGFGLVVACLSLGIGKPFLLPPPNMIPTASTTVSLIRQFAPRSLMTVPHILEEISQQLEPASPVSSPTVTALRTLQFVACGGGPLKIVVGERLVAQGVRLLNHFGSTETGPLGAFMVPGEEYDWHFWPLRRDVDIRVEQVEEVDNTGPPEKNAYQISMRPFGWDEDFILQDRFERDERTPLGKCELPPAFRATGRKDDLIVLVTGEKVQPQTLEAAVEASDMVKTAVAFGEGEFELGLLVEPTSPQEDAAGFRDILWPVVEKACESMDSHAQIASPASVVVLNSGCSLPRSDKGSVLRREAYKMFRDEIRQAYEHMKHTVAKDSTLRLDPAHLEDDLGDLIKQEVGDNLDTQELQPDDDLFEKGINSLQAVRIQRTIAGAVENNEGILPVKQDEIGVDFVYKHPTINQMIDALVRRTRSVANKNDDIGDYIAQFSLRREAKGHVVLLTGSSGSLGSYLLDILVADKDVAEVICLVRTSSIGQRDSQSLAAEQIRNAEQKGVRIPWDLQSKVTAFEANPSAPNLGLVSQKYLEVCSKITHVLHAAWPMDFQRSLSSFQTQFTFLNSLLKLTRDAHEAKPLLKPRLVFLSSIAVVGKYHEVHGSRIVPEEVMKDDRVTNEFGYGKAKFVCERIVANAAADFSDEMEVACVRVGQVSGAQESGFWNSKEHFPTLIRVCHKLGKFPRLEGTLSWLPVDTDAAVLGDILLSQGSLKPVYHVENPVRQDWTPIMATVAEKLGHSASAFVEFADWLELVRADGVRKGHQDPEVDMLMHFFEHEFQHMSSGGVILDTSGAREKSSALRNADKVGEEVVARYAQQWQSEGLLA